MFFGDSMEAPMFFVGQLLNKLIIFFSFEAIIFLFVLFFFFVATKLTCAHYLIGILYSHYLSFWQGIMLKLYQGCVSWYHIKVSFCKINVSELFWTLEKLKLVLASLDGLLWLAFLWLVALWET